MSHSNSEGANAPHHWVPLAVLTHAVCQVLGRTQRKSSMRVVRERVEMGPKGGWDRGSLTG